MLIDVFNVLLVNISGQKKIIKITDITRLSKKDIKDVYLKRIVHGKNVKFVIQILWIQSFLYQQKKISSWEILLDCEITDWSKYFIIFKKSCKNSSSNFQFKLTQNYSYQFLFAQNKALKNTNVCTFSKIHDETIEHLFFDPLWHKVFSHLCQLNQNCKNLIFDKK